MFGFGKEKTNEEDIKSSKKVKMAMAATAIAAAAVAAGVKEAPATEQPEQPAVISEVPVTSIAQAETTIPQSTTTEAAPVEISEEAVTISRDQVEEYPSVPLTPVAPVDGETGLPTYVDGADGIQRIVPENPSDGPGEIAPPSLEDVQRPPEPQL